MNPIQEYESIMKIKLSERDEILFTQAYGIAVSKAASRIKELEEAISNSLNDLWMCTDCGRWQLGSKKRDKLASVLPKGKARHG